VFWPYFCGISILALGGYRASRESSDLKWPDKVIAWGPVFFAAPMAVFGGEHLTIAKAMAPMVPEWLPAHLFWVYFVGVALEAAALSIVVNRSRNVSSTLLGVMLLLFVLLIHLRGLTGNPKDVRAITVALRDIAFGSTAIAYGTSQSRIGLRIVPIARCIVGLSFLFFAWQYFPHPDLTPVTPLGMKNPGWIPLQWIWGYGVAIALILAGIMLVVNWQSRRAAEWIGVLIFASVLFVYLPILTANPGDIGVAMNYVADTLAISGEALLLAGLLPEQGFRAAWDLRQAAPKMPDPSSTS
jgi:hypothetical protein